ncbi:protein kinase [Planctomycetota bacterium]
MQRYQYQHGDRPLEGYTIQRAAGRGGFGEVYYAVSDSGREVAIKAVQNYEQIELRGISQCMNLKSPHLVSVFDVKYNDQKEPFVIMEYVSGPSLRELLTESPHGLGTQKAAFFLREIAKSLSYLHECGIVHRDLKPSNIFYENGYVKVGDYGLAKAISASRHSGHTITVGTVSYMAPEIGAGSYNRSIDIYALGVLLYEMLTGDVPFIGSSPAEVLMKHMTVTPELKNVEEPFRKVITKALAKDPADRYQTVQEMVEDLFGSENIRNSVSHFSPNELSVIAEKVAAKANIVEQPRPQKPRAQVAAQETRGVGGEVAAQPTRGVGKELTQTAQKFAQQADVMGQKVAARVDVEANKLLGARSRVIDPVDPHQRRTLAILSMVLVALGAALLSGSRGGFPTIAFAVFAMTAVCSKTILYSRRRWFGNLEPEAQWVPKVVTCCLAALFASMIAGFMTVAGHFSGIGGLSSPGTSLWLSLAVPMLLVDWGRITSPQRSKRLSLGSAIWIGLLGFISAAIFDQPGVMIASVLAGTSLVVQAYSLFGHVAEQAPAVKAQHQKAKEKKKETPSQSLATGRPVPSYVRALWLVGFFTTLGLGLFLVIMAGVGLRGDDFTFAVAFGVDSLILSLFCIVGACRSRFNGWYRYIIKPGILLICVLTIVFSSICMGSMRLRDEEFFISLMLIIFPAIAFFVVGILPARLFVGPVPKSGAAPSPPPPLPQVRSGVSSYKRMWALLLSAGGLFGFCGLHRFYVGKIGTGILWFLTWGLFGVGQLIDVILIIVGQFKDRYDRPLEIWMDERESASVKTTGAKPVSPPRTSRQKVAPAVNQTAEKQQVRTVKDSPAPPAPTTTVVYQPFHPLAFLCSGVGFILVFVAVIIGLATALHIPYLVAAGVPELAQEMEESFGGYAEWPELFMRLGMMVTAGLLVIAAIFIVTGRRHLGARHLIRGVLGLGGLFATVMWLSDGIAWSFRRGMNDLGSQPLGAVLEQMLKGCQNEEVVMAGMFFLLSVVVLAWPARPKQVMLTPALNQGVS